MSESPSWEGSELQLALWAMLAEVDQLSAEYRDPNTSPQRKQRIHNMLSQLYFDLKRFQRQG